jgi:DHA3 family macrolide efflux protein-like MFS transporter
MQDNNALTAESSDATTPMDLPTDSSAGLDLPAGTNWKRNVSLLLVAQSITLFGSMLVHYAIMWHITLQTQSGTMMTMVALAGALPMFFASPFGGVWADRFNKKLVINIADAVIAVVTLGIAVYYTVGFESMALLLVAMVIRALGQGIQMPAVGALVPQLVPQEQLLRFNGIAGSMQSIVMFASPLAGGMLLGLMPIHALMYVDVVTAVIGITLFTFLVRIPKTSTSYDKHGVRHYFTDIKEGLSYMRTHLFVMKFLAGAAIFNIMVAPASMLTPLQVARNWGGDSWSLFGMLSLGAPQRLAAIEMAFFIGMMLGGLILGIWGGFKNKSHTMALATVMFGLGTVGLGLLDNFWLYLACMLGIGVFLNVFNPAMMATLQTNVDQEYMGRVFSVLAMASSLMMPLGMMLWGPLSDQVAIDWLLIGTGIALTLFGLVFVVDKTMLAAGKAAGEAEAAQATNPAEGQAGVALIES